ncbi:MAG: primosomal protein N' [Polyangiales bacterium]
MSFVDVAIPVPLRRTFTYKIPPGLTLQPGHRVAVPFHRRKVAGFVVALRDEAPEGVRVLSVAGLLEEEPVFPADLLAFLDEAARYYLHPIGEVLRAAAPALPKGAMQKLREGGFLDDDESLRGRSVATIKELFAKDAVRDDVLHERSVRLGARQRALLALVQERGEVALSELRELHGPSARGTLRALEKKSLLVLEEREVQRDPFLGRPVERDVPPPLHPAQQFAVERMTEALHARTPGGSGFLLHGVTGSGKTEVYLHVIEEAQKLGRGALLLVPEIALTPQLAHRFRARFGDGIAVLHSALGERERDDFWRRLRKGELKLAVGARSALFAPIDDLGVIVVDEEHDGSFKQEEGFRYHARDMALLRANRQNAVCILGSATPSVESFHRAIEGQLSLLSLPERATAQKLPSVEMVDLKRWRPASDATGPRGGAALFLTAPLLRALGECLDAESQAILFLNRRGFVPALRCFACGAGVECPLCSVTLTEHRKAGELRCHYCDFRTEVPTVCKTCGADALEPLGLGTEQLEHALLERFPDARVARLDRDTATGKNVEAVLDRLRRREVDILVGTQMVTKGHDLPGVTLVGVVLADQSLAFPDFRAGERTFQLLAQVAGRAGRGEREGRVIFQSFQPEHPAIVAAASHDYEGFFRSEIEERRDLEYPPFGRMIAVRVDAPDEQLAKRTAEHLARFAKAHPATTSGALKVQGPAPAPIARLRARYRQRFLVRGERGPLRQVAARIASAIDEGLGTARASVDVDPVSML